MTAISTLAESFQAWAQLVQTTVSQSTRSFRLPHIQSSTQLMEFDILHPTHFRAALAIIMQAPTDATIYAAPPCPLFLWNTRRSPSSSIQSSTATNTSGEGPEQDYNVS